MHEQKIKKGICGICPYNCEVCIELQDGTITHVKADLDAPDGSICPRGMRSAEIVYSDSRIRYPMIRNGKKGTKSFRRASWEEALSVAAEGFKKCKETYGAQSLVSYSGASSLEDSLVEYGDSFFSYYGSPNDMNSGSICFVPSRVMGPQLTIGMDGCHISADIRSSKVIYIWGSNPETDSGKSRYGELLELQKKGAVLVAIDPRSSRMTKRADYWIRVKPGTDGALLLALTKRIIENAEYDADFVKKYTSGMELYQKELQKYSIEALLKECGVSTGDFEKLCALFSTGTAQSFLSYTGLEYQPSGVDTIRMLYILWAITGKLDVPGGMLISEGTKAIYEPDTTNGILPIGAERYPVFYFYSERGQFGEFPEAAVHGRPYPARGLLIYGASPLLSYPDRKQMEEAYAKQDMMVVIERSWSDECLWADVVLPATTYYENQSFCYYKNRIRIREQIIEPVGESRNDVYILHDLAEKLGFGDRFPACDEELLGRAFSKEEIEGMKKNLYGNIRKSKERHYKKYATGSLREDGEAGFPTRSGKLEIDSVILREYGYPGVPRYVSPYKNKSYPYVLVTGARSRYRYNANGTACKSLVDAGDIPCMEMGLDLAKKLGIKEKELAEITTENGTLILPVQICPMAVDTVHIPSGGGGEFQDQRWKNCNANSLCDFEKRDKISGFITCKSTGCNIKKFERK